MDIRQTRISDGDNILVLQMDNLIAGKLILILFFINSFPLALSVLL